MMTMITGAEAVTTIWRQKCERQGSANQLKSPQHMPNLQTVFLTNGFKVFIKQLPHIVIRFD